MIIKSKIAISGISCINGLGEGLNAWIEALSIKKQIPFRIEPKIFQDEIDKVQKGPHEMYRIQKIAAVTFLKVLKDAGIVITKSNADRIGIFLGNTYGVEEFKAKFFKIIKQSPPDLTNPSFFPYTTINSISANLSILLGIRGKNVTFCNGATSVSEAIIAACDILFSGAADIFIIGGESFLCEDFEEEFRNSGFQQECCAALVLEREEDVINSGRKIYASIEECQHGFLRNDFGEKNIFSISQRLAENIYEKGNIDCTVLNQGSSLGDRRSMSEEVVICDRKNKYFLSLESLFGNTFSASGALGVNLSCLLLNQEQKGILGIDKKRNDFKKILFINKDSYGSYASIVVSGGQHERYIK